jgi:hypothetical protein
MAIYTVNIANIADIVKVFGIMTDKETKFFTTFSMTLIVCDWIPTFVGMRREITGHYSSLGFL